MLKVYQNINLIVLIFNEKKFFWFLPSFFLILTKKFGVTYYLVFALFVNNNDVSILTA